MTDSYPVGRAVFKAVRASLRLASSSSELLSLSQLLAIKDDLRETLAIINGQIEAEQSDDRKVVIDMSDWESGSDEDEASRNRETSAVRCGESKDEPLPIPDPYPVSPPEMDELPDYWYVVDCGTEVGIFADNASSTRAVSGVPNGHQLRVKTWYEAAILYNKLYHQGGIVRVHA